eukprot:1982668-Ditylum_brightwellii.AAC.1
MIDQQQATYVDPHLFNQNLGVEGGSSGDVARIFYYALGLASQEKVILSSSEVTFPRSKL